MFHEWKPETKARHIERRQCEMHAGDVDRQLGLQERVTRDTAKGDTEGALFWQELLNEEIARNGNLLKP